MITGIGTDIVAIGRMRTLLENWGSEKVAKRFLADPETVAFFNAKSPERFLAKRFAVKEAFSKAMGTGVRAPVLLNAIWVENDALGRPVLCTNQAVQALMSKKNIVRCHVSISDEVEYATAFIVLETD